MTTTTTIIVAVLVLAAAVAWARSTPYVDSPTRSLSTVGAAAPSLGWSRGRVNHRSQPALPPALGELVVWIDGLGAEHEDFVAAVVEQLLEGADRDPALSAGRAAAAAHETDPGRVVGPDHFAVLAAVPGQRRGDLLDQRRSFGVLDGHRANVRGWSPARGRVAVTAVEVRPGAGGP